MEELEMEEENHDWALIEELLDKFYKPHPLYVDRETEGMELLTTFEMMERIMSVIRTVPPVSEFARLLLGKGYELIGSGGTKYWKVWGVG